LRTNQCEARAKAEPAGGAGDRRSFPEGIARIEAHNIEVESVNVGRESTPMC
jgi:hypothetical protein